MSRFVKLQLSHRKDLQIPTEYMQVAIPHIQAVCYAHLSVEQYQEPTSTLVLCGDGSSNESFLYVIGTPDDIVKAIEEAENG